MAALRSRFAASSLSKCLLRKAESSVPDAQRRLDPGRPFTRWRLCPVGAGRGLLTCASPGRCPSGMLSFVNTVSVRHSSSQVNCGN
ncbi:mitochondrial inner membrane protein OXA1L-like [Arapaima gigas]